MTHPAAPTGRACGMPCHARRAANGMTGFTLIEIIVTIIIAAIVGVMMLPLTGASLRGSAESLLRAERQARLIDVMETMTADFRFIFSNPDGTGDPLDTFSAKVGNVGSNTTAYGTYRIIEKRLIGFDSNHNETSGTNILKLTIEVEGSRVTCLFGQ